MLLHVSSQVSTNLFMCNMKCCTTKKQTKKTPLKYCKNVYTLTRLFFGLFNRIEIETLPQLLR